MRALLFKVRQAFSVLNGGWHAPREAVGDATQPRVKAVRRLKSKPNEQVKQKSRLFGIAPPGAKARFDFTYASPAISTAVFRKGICRVIKNSPANQTTLECLMSHDQDSAMLAILKLPFGKHWLAPKLPNLLSVIDLEV
jgi:hypothetical protein